MSKPRRPRRAVTGILLLDKPLGISSNAALQRVKILYQADKAGHTGSLDPLATGALPICLGEATKLSGVLLDADKSYEAIGRLGARTSTGDAEGEVVDTAPITLTQAMLDAVRPRFLGAIQQVPPMYSALKHEGERLYALARRGEEVERTARDITIYALDLQLQGTDAIRALVRCSKGTYIRTLVEDIAAAAGQCAHLSALRRIEVSPFEGLPLVTMEQLDSALNTGGLAAIDALLLDPAAALKHWPQLTVDEARAHYLSQGQAVRVAGLEAAERLAVLDESGRLLGLAQAGAGGIVAPKRWFCI
ncbi:MAG: tRNA pseudouridine(55) synthase TruB [Pseudomonadota bacterium]|nr:tRNA pseudouridine(55) synthase TruB [Pseudomonadota bacterium]